jgi:uncharacterized protein YggE
MAEMREPRGDEATGAVSPTVNVRASATVDAVPDEARVHFDLSASERSADAALDAIRDRTRQIDTVLDELGIDPSDRTSTVRVGEQGERSGGKWLSKGYQAFAGVSVVVRDMDAVGPLVNETVARAGPEVRGPYWRVSPDHPARLEACRKAAADAKAKAEAYADALGVALGEIVRVAEPGSRTIEAPIAQPVAPQPVAAAGRATSASPDARPPLDLRPGRQEVHAAVEVIFGLEPG